MIILVLLLINDVLSLKKGYPKANLTFRTSIQQSQTSTYTLHTHGAHSLIEFRKKKKTSGNVMMMVTAAAVYSNGQLLSTLLMNRNRVFLSLSLSLCAFHVLIFSPIKPFSFQLIHFFFLNARARSFVLVDSYVVLIGCFLFKQWPHEDNLIVGSCNL